MIAQAQGWFSVAAPKRVALRDSLVDIRDHAASLRTALASAPGAIIPNLYSRGIDVRRLRTELDLLTRAATRELPKVNAFKDTKEKPTTPIVLIARVVRTCMRPAASDGGPFMRVIEICYRSMGASDADMPSRRTLGQALELLKRARQPKKKQ